MIRPKIDSTQAGFSLLEALVALVVLSIGLIGVASVHVQGLQFGQQALTSMRAISLASDMADRIRANATARDDYASDRGGPGAAPAPCADAPGALVSTDCTPQGMALFDVWQWKDAIASSNGLLNGEGEIVVATVGAVTEYEITVYWDERGEARSYKVKVQL